MTRQAFSRVMLSPTPGKECRPPSAVNNNLALFSDSHNRQKKRFARVSAAENEAEF